MAWEYRIKQYGDGSFVVVEVSTSSHGGVTWCPAEICQDSREAVLSEIARMLKECAENPVVKE